LHGARRVVSHDALDRPHAHAVVQLETIDPRIDVGQRLALEVLADQQAHGHRSGGVLAVRLRLDPEVVTMGDLHREQQRTCRHPPAEPNGFFAAHRSSV
jgi:hypothetical protein